MESNLQIQHVRGQGYRVIDPRTGNIRAEVRDRREAERFIRRTTKS